MMLCASCLTPTCRSLQSLSPAGFAQFGEAESELREKRKSVWASERRGWKEGDLSGDEEGEVGRST